MDELFVQDCKIISISGEEESFIITIGSYIIFINSNAYNHSGKITSILPNGFYIEDKRHGNCFVQWDQIVDIMSVDNGDLLKFIKR